MKGLKREESVFVNRLQHEYAKDQLPNPEQVRQDVLRLLKIALRLNQDIWKLDGSKP